MNNKHIPKGYYVMGSIEDGQAFTTLYSPFSKKSIDPVTGHYYDSSEPRPVAKWSGRVKQAEVNEMAELDHESFTGGLGAAYATSRLADIFRGEQIV